MHPTPKRLPYATTAAVLILSSLFLARAASADPITLAWDANAASDNVIGYKVYVGTQPGIYTQTTDVGNATSYVFPDAVAGQKYYFAVSAYASGPIEGLKSTEASGWSNAPPALVSPGNQSNVVGTAITPLQLQGSDPYGEPVSYSATNLPPGLTLQTSTGLIMGTGTTAGTYSVTATVRDGAVPPLTNSKTFTWTMTTPTSPPTVSLTAPANGATYTAPASVTVNATASDSDGTITKVDFFAGTTLIGSDSTSPYSVTWSNAPAGSYSLTAIATDNDGAATSSGARTVTVTGTAPLPPAPWTAADIGGPAQAGSTQYANGTYTVNGGGEVGGTADQFQFVYRTASGDVDIRARVGSVQAVQAWSKAGVMVRESLAANAAMGMMFISATSGSAFHQRLATGADRTSTTGTAVAAPYWVRLERRGTTLTASQSADGVTWTTIDTMSISAADVVVGLAVASGDPALAATATFDNVVVSTPNQAPTVSLTAPANGATYTAPATVTMNATASDSDGTITKVDFYAGTTLIGTDTTSPYSVTWSNAAAGTYGLTAVATDNGGTPTTSAAVTITVTALQASVTLSPDPAGVAATLTATVSNGPRNPGDWVGLFPETADDRSFVGWCYLNGSTTAPAAGVSSASVTCMSPAAPGRYQVRLFANNGFTRLATSNTITVSTPPAITISDVSTTEGQTGTKNFVFTVNLSSATTLPVTVRYATSNGTATAGSDYTAASGTLTFTAGITSRTFSVPVIGDTAFEPNETFSTTLSQPTNATIADTDGLGTIVNDDAAPGAAVALTPDPAAVGATLSTTVSSNPGNATDWVGLYAETALDNTFLDWCYLNGTKTVPATGVANATVTCFTAPASGRYQVRLFINNTMTKVATSNTITVSGPSGPSVALSPNSPAVGATLSAAVNGGPGNTGDWVGLYLETAPDSTFVDWCFLNGTKTAPSTGLSTATLNCFTVPASGRYQVRLFINNTFTKVATSNTAVGLGMRPIGWACIWRPRQTVPLWTGAS